MIGDTRILTRNILTGEWLTKSLPLGQTEYGPELNGPGSLTGTLSPRLADELFAAIDPGNTFIYVERAGQLRWGGIIWDGRATDQAYAIEAASWTSYLQHRYDIDGNLNGRGPYTNVDRCKVIRDIWAYAQAAPDGNLQVVVDPTTSTSLVGTTAEPLAYNWWELPCLGDALDDLVSADAAPQYTCDVYWNADHTTPVHRLRIGYPRIGARRTDISFATGINIITPPEIPEAADDYAQVVIANGSGDGSAKRRAISAVRNGRLRMESILDLPDISGTDVLSSRAAAESAWRQTMGTVQEITVRDTPSAPFGSWQVGDDVTVRVNNAWASFRGWCRITGWSEQPDAAGGPQAVIQLQPSASYTYGSAT